MQRPRLARLVIWSLFLCALAVTGHSLWEGWHRGAAPDTVSAVWFLLALTGYWWLNRVAVARPNQLLSLSFVALVMVALLAGLPWAILMAATWILQSTAPEWRLFGWARHVLAAAGLIATANWLEHGLAISGPAGWLWEWPALTAVFWLAHIGTLLLVRWLRGTAHLADLLRFAVRTMPGYLVAMGTALLSVHLYGVVGWPVFLMTGVAVWGLYKYEDSLLLLARKDELSLRSMIAAIDAKDPFTRGHSERVAELAFGLANAMGLSAHEAEQIRQAALVHDLGKMGIPEAVLTKAGPLTAEEWTQVRAHPVIGERTLAANPEWGLWAQVAGQHHERWDGSGYPRGLAGQEICLAARIVAVADAFDAMTSDRAYRPAHSVDQALAEIARGAGRQFDPVVAAAFVQWQTVPAGPPAAPARPAESRGADEPAAPDQPALAAISRYIRMHGRTWHLELMYGLTGIGVCAWAILHLPAGGWLHLLPLFLLAAGLAPFVIDLKEGIKLPASQPVEVAFLLVGHPAECILLASFTALTAAVWYRRPLLRVLYNMANYAVPAALCAAFLHWALPPWPQPLRVPDHLPYIVVVLAMRHFLNLTATSAIISVERREPFHSVWVSVVRVEGVIGVTLRLVPLLMAMAYPVGGWWAMLAGGLAVMALSRAVRIFAHSQALERQALTDGLTGAGNRHAWQQYLEQHRGPGGQPQLVAMVDMDGLKVTNDTHGHDQGDAVLVDLARRLAAAAPDGRVFRLGGDEFVVAVARAQLFGPAHLALQEAIAAFTAHWREQGHAVSASAGFAASPVEAATLDQAVSLADQRMYEVKGRRGEPAYSQ